MKTIQEKIERMDLTMARRPKGNYEAYVNQVSSVIVLQDEVLFALLMIQLEDNLLMTPSAHWASENEKVLTKKENPLVAEDQTAFFSSPGL